MSAHTLTRELLTLWANTPTWERAATILLALVMLLMFTLLLVGTWRAEHSQARQVEREIEREIDTILARRPSK